MKNTSLRWLLLAALAFGPASLACGGDDEEDTTAEEGEETSGGESRDLERPEGSREPDDDGSDYRPDEPDDDEPSAAAEPDPDEPSPWGQTRAEQCQPPTRREINSSAQRAIRQGIQAASSNDLEAAQTAFRNALSEDSNAYKAAYNLGVIADRRGQESRAMDYYQQALRIQSDYERAAEGVVTIHLRRNDVNAALSFVQPLARVHRTNLHLQALYAEVLVRAERYDQAWDAARLALRCDERFVPALTALVKASLAQGRDELANTILDQAIDVDEENAELHYIRGTLYREEAGRFRDALQSFERAVQLRPDYAEARVALGSAQLAGGNYTTALEHFEAAARLAPQLVAVHLNLADAYRASKQWNKAKTTFERALEMDPNLAQAHFNMGLMYMAAGEEFPGLDALQALEAAKQEFTRYRDLMGSRMERNDPSVGYMEDLDRQIDRTRRRMERDRARAEREAREAARSEEEGGGDEGATE